MKPSRLQAVDDVAIEVPAGMEDAFRWFYGEVGHLLEVSSVEDGRLLGFRSARLELRLMVRERPEVDPVRRRLTLLVPSLARAMEQLDEHGVAWWPISSLVGTDRRIAALDPAGHRVELKQEWPEAPL